MSNIPTTGYIVNGYSWLELRFPFCRPLPFRPVLGPHAPFAESPPIRSARYAATGPSVSMVIAGMHRGACNLACRAGTPAVAFHGSITLSVLPTIGRQTGARPACALSRNRRRSSPPGTL